MLKRIWIFVLLSALLGGSPAFAGAQDTGLAFFGLLSPQFPCKQALAGFGNSGPLALAVLWGTFGEDTACLKQWLSLRPDQPHFLEIHLTNEACRRNSRCEPGEFAASQSVKGYNHLLETRDPGTLADLAARVTKIAQAIKPLLRPSTEVVISTGLEDNFTPEAYTAAFETVHSAWQYKIVRSPVGTQHAYSAGAADFLELHGEKPNFPPGSKCIANLDGTDMDFPHRPAATKRRIPWETANEYLKSYKARCRVTFLWAAPWQGITADIFVQPLSRTISFDSRDMQEAAKLMTK